MTRGDSRGDNLILLRFSTISVIINENESDPCCGRWNNGLQDVHVPFPSTCEHVILHGKRGFVDMGKLKILRQGSYLVLTRWLQGGQSQRRCDRRNQDQRQREV